MNLSLFKSFATLTAAETFSKVLTFAAFAYLARICGPAGFGYIEWSAAVLMCASLIVDQGFNSYGAREIARQPSRTANLINEIVTARFLLAAISYLAIAIFAFAFVTVPVVSDLLLLFGISLFALPLLLQWVFQGHDRMDLVAITQIVRQSVFVLTVLLLVRAAGDLVFVGAAEVAAVSIAAVLSVLLYRRSLGGKLRFKPVLSSELFRAGVPIGLGQMFWVVRMFGATLIVGLVATAEDTGYFAAAMRILIALHTFVWLYYFNLFPSMSRAWIEGVPAFSRLIARSMRWVVFASAATGIIWYLASTFVIATAYGSGFVVGAPALQLMAGVWIAAAISGHFRFGLIAAGEQNKEMVASAIGAVAALTLIPIGYLQAGIAGSALALCIAESLVLLTSWLFARRLFKAENIADSTSVENGLDGLREAAQ